MQVEYSNEGERLVARPEGRMEASDGDAFAATLEQRLGERERFITIDLDRLEFVNFGAIRAILRLARSFKDAGRTLEFVRGNEAVRDALDQAGLDDLFPFKPPYVSSRGKT